MEAEAARRAEREQLYQETAGMDMGGGGMVPTGAEHLYSEMEGDARGHDAVRAGWGEEESGREKGTKRERSYDDEEDQELYGHTEKNPRFRDDDDAEDV